MIRKLKLLNFILVTEIELEFSDGLQVITGETGAGKSILVGALSLILGGTLRQYQAFDVSKSIFLEAVFSVEKEQKGLQHLLEQYGIDEDEELILAKEINPAGKITCYLNGRKVTNNTLKEFGEELLDFHGQNEHQRLLQRSYQLDLLDEFGNLMEMRDSFRSQYHSLLDKCTELQGMKLAEQSLKDKMELFKYQKDEIEEARLTLNEDEDLQKELNILTHAGEIQQLTSEGLHFLYEGDQTSYDQLNTFISKLSHYTTDHVHIAASVQHLNDCLGYLDEAIQELRLLQDSVQIDDQRLVEVEQRWNEINRFKAKYRVQKIDDVIIYLNMINQSLRDYQSNQKQISDLAEIIQSDCAKLKSQADVLTDSRKKAAIQFSALVEENIHQLAIPDGKIEIQFDKKQDIIDKTQDALLYYNDRGQDGIDFYFSANRGSPIQLLKHAVSGGELSRLLLAIKKILSDKLEKRVIVFDEIDAGIGGKTADSLAGFIRSIAKYHQVLCITHLPQIAAAATHQYAIEKKARKDKTEMYVELLLPDERVHEIARMLSGMTTETALQHANELLNRNRGRD